MKFQSCILINFERTHGRMDGRKDARTRTCTLLAISILECLVANNILY